MTDAKSTKWNISVIDFTHDRCDQNTHTQLMFISLTDIDIFVLAMFGFKGHELANGHLAGLGNTCANLLAVNGDKIA